MLLLKEEEDALLMRRSKLEAKGNGNVGNSHLGRYIGGDLQQRGTTNLRRICIRSFPWIPNRSQTDRIGRCKAMAKKEGGGTGKAFLRVSKDLLLSTAVGTSSWPRVWGLNGVARTLSLAASVSIGGMFHTRAGDPTPHRPINTHNHRTKGCYLIFSPSLSLSG